MANPATKQALAAAAWQRLFEFFMHTSPRREAALERFGLTPNDARALHTLDPAVGRSMRALADSWGTDASNATWVVDRLERKGLARREVPAHDRRIKLVVLTPLGVQTRDELLGAFLEPPPELLTLDRRTLGTLRDIAHALAEAAGATQAAEE